MMIMMMMMMIIIIIIIVVVVVSIVVYRISLIRFIDCVIREHQAPHLQERAHYEAKAGYDRGDDDDDDDDDDACDM